MISVHPIADGDLPAATDFMHRHLNPAIPRETWLAAFRQGWMEGDETKPNNGFLLRDGDEIVGVLGALYSTQRAPGAGGAVRRVCNLTSLVLLPAYRSRALDLLARCVGQPGFDFTNLTPNPAVERICTMMKFRPVDSGEYVFALPPVPSRGVAVRGSDEPGFDGLLSREDARDWASHRAFRWLRAVAFRRGGESGVAVYTLSSVGGRLRLPAARFLHISAPGLFLAAMRPIGAHLARRRGILVGRVERRLLPAKPPLALEREGLQPRLYRGAAVEDGAAPNLYSERVALPI